MGRLATLVAAVGILAAAYAVSFGVPPWLSELAGTGAGQEESVATDSRAAGAGRPGGPRGRSASTSVVTTPLELKPHDSVLSAIGTASALRSVQVISEGGGTVTEANLSANREVEAGEVLLRLDARTEVLNHEIATAELEKAEDTVSRYERLRENGSSTVTDVTLSEAQVNQRLAEAAVGLAEIALEDRTVRAPISGRLGLSDIDVGDELSANSSIVTLDQSDTLVVEFELPERAIGLLAEAEEILASTSTLTGRVFTGRIMSFDSRIDPVTRSVTVKAQIDNSDGLLWPGMTFSVRLEQRSDPLPALPSTAITWSRSGSSVWIDADGTAREVPVTILFRRDETVWIEADIAEGTDVVTEGAQKLRDGASISTGSSPRDGTPSGTDGTGRPEAGRDADPETPAKERT